MVRRVMKDAFVVWKNSRSIFGLTNYFAGQPRVAGAILSILFGLFLSACGGGGGVGSPPDDPLPPGDDLTLPIFVDAPVQGLHYRQVGPVTLISRSQETDGRGGFNPGNNYGTVAFAVGEITVDGDGMTLSQYGSNGFLGFIVHPVGEWQYGVFTPYDLRTTLSDASVNTVSAGTVNVGAVARVLQGFDQIRPTTSEDGANIDDDLILIHQGATADRKVIFGPTDLAGEFSVQEGEASPDKVEEDESYEVTISLRTDRSGATLYSGTVLIISPLSEAMLNLSMVISVMANKIAPFTDKSTLTLKGREESTGYFARRGSYSLLDPNGSGATIDPDTGSITYAPTSGEPTENVSVQFQYGQFVRNQLVELNALPALRTDAKSFQIYFTSGKDVALTLTVGKGGNAPLRYKLTPPPNTDLRRYGLRLDRESGILFGRPKLSNEPPEKGFTVDMDLDVVDAGGDEVDQDEPDLQFQIVSREGEPAYYEIDLRKGAGSAATLIFSDRNGNIPSKDLTEKSIIRLDSNCRLSPNTPDFGNIDCPYSVGYGYSDPGNGVTVVVGLKSSVTVSGGASVSVCVGPSVNGGKCPAGVKMFTASFISVYGKPSSVTVRMLLPLPAFDPEFASDDFATYIQSSPNPSRRPLPAADGGNGRLVYSAVLPPGLTLHSATRRLSGRPTVTVSSDMPFALTMTVADLNGKKDATGNFLNSAAYLFTIVVQPDRMPTFAADATASFTTDLSVAATLTLPVATEYNREIIYSVSGLTLPGMMNFDPETRELSGTPTVAVLTMFNYIATDPDEAEDENGNLHIADDDMTTLTITVFVDGKPSFGSQTVDEQRYIVSSPIPALTLPKASGGNPPLIYTLTDLMGGDNLAGLTLNARELSGTPDREGTTVLIYTVTDSDPSDSDSATLSVTVNIAGDVSPMFPASGSDPITLTQAWPITPAITLTAATGGNLGIVYSIENENNLPRGVMFEGGDTRELSGTPTTVGNVHDPDHRQG